MYLYIETLKQRTGYQSTACGSRLLAMGPAFQQVYSLLPTLLHYHHPLMPGYLDGNVPKGICLFTPDEPGGIISTNLNSLPWHALARNPER